MFQELGHLNSRGHPTQQWHTFRTKGYAKATGDRHPVGTKTKTVLYVDAAGKNRYKYATAVSSMYMNEIMDYITSRKHIYCLGYARLVKLIPV